MGKGYVSIHREIRSNWVWDDKPFSRGQAWIDLIIMANHSDGKMMFDGSLIDVKRGDVVTSETKLSERWGWSRKKVHAFIDCLAADSMLVAKRHTKGAYLNLCNYCAWQDSGTAKEHEKHSRSTAEAQQKNTINNGNNSNNEKQKRFTPPELSEVMAYVSEKSLSVDPKRFYDYFTAGNWHDSHGKPVKNWKQKIITWGSHNQPAPQKPKPNIPYQQPYHYED